MVFEQKTKVAGLMEQAVREGTFPGGVLLVSRGRGVVFHEAFGHRSLIPQSEPMEKDTVFDLASLTKPLATALAVMKLVDKGRLRLDRPVGEVIPAPLKDKQDLTPRLLLGHGAGFPDWKPFHLDLVAHDPGERKRLLRKWLVEEPLLHARGQGCLYSDLGYMFLEWVVESASGQPMKDFVEKEIYGPLGLDTMFLATEESLRDRDRHGFSATEDCPWRHRVIQGEVHDENAFALGGYSGHAGLFGRAEDVYSLAHLLKAHFFGSRHDFVSSRVVRKFFLRQDMLPGCTWALGWDTPSAKDCSCGRYFSQSSVGHLGFTGTSVWMDLQQDVVVVLLTNRIHPSRRNETIRTFRPRLHDAAMEALGLAKVPKAPKVGIWKA